MKGNKWRDTSKEPDTTSQKGSQMMGNSKYTKRIKERHPKGRTPPARRGGKQKETSKNTHPESRTPQAHREKNEGRPIKRDIRRAGHHLPDWETNQGGELKTDIQRAGHHRTPPARQGDRWRETSTEYEFPKKPGSGIMPIIILCPSRQNTSRNPPAPKVPRRGSLAADTNGQICQTDTASAEWVGPHVATSAPLGVNFAPTWTHFAPTSKHPFHWYRPLFLLSRRFVWGYVPHVVSPLGPTWCEAVAKGPQVAQCCTWPDVHMPQKPSHGFTLGSIWIASEENADVKSEKTREMKSVGTWKGYI